MQFCDRMHHDIMNTKYIKFIIFIVCLLIIGLFFSPELILVKDYFYKITKPFSQKILTVSNNAGGIISDIKNIRSLQRENSEYEKENNDLKAKIAALSEVSHENDVLKKELGFVGASPEKELIPARVINKSPASFFQNIRIDKGSSSGVEKGKAVLSEGYLIGIVQDVGKDYSDVTLIIDSRSLVAVVLQDSRGTGLLRGGLKGLTMEDIPLDIKTKKGEMVVTSGIGDGLPSGIAVGQVEEIISSTSEIFQRATVKSPIEFGNIEFAFVVK